MVVCNSRPRQIVLKTKFGVGRKWVGIINHPLQFIIIPVYYPKFCSSFHRVVGYIQALALTVYNPALSFVRDSWLLHFDSYWG